MKSTYDQLARKHPVNLTINEDLRRLCKNP